VLFSVQLKINELNFSLLLDNEEESGFLVYESQKSPGGQATKSDQVI
jgi:hypothetical protein